MSARNKPARNIVWLASYPKSGNTWARVFLGNYLFNRTTPMPINEVNRVGISDSSASLYRAVANGPFDPADPMQALQLRRRALGAIAGNGADINFVKSHNTRERVFGVELIPASVSRAAIYIIRDPRDVAVSFARHYGYTPAKAIDLISRRSNSTAGGGSTVKQFLSSWSGHVASWARCRDFPVLVLRYEDMQADPHAAFTKVLQHVGIPVEQDRLDRAVRFSAFDELRGQEEREAFIERSSKSERFFHTGTSGQWRDLLSDELVERIRLDHGAVMRKFGYLD